MFALLMKWMQAKHLLPKISETERQALEAGDVWIEGGFFAGKPDFNRILRQPYAVLTVEEQAFLDGPCNALLAMVDAYEVARTRKVPEDVLAFIKAHGFMGLLIPKRYGGKEFSPLAISTIMAKLNTHSFTVGTYVMIPNSLGAAELISHYGTDAQKDSYLPKLATGEYVPCFGLTEPTAGSDAASIKAEGALFRDEAGELQIRLNFRKRYITLAPTANLVTLACRLKDPGNLLGKGEDVGITTVLIHKGTPGFVSGDHHDPIGEAFDNGPLTGVNVIIPVSHIIGGAANAGNGWRMLMEQLAGGRAVSLPAGAIGSAKRVVATVGAYSMVRQQFGIAIGHMEGVEEKVGKIAALTYLLEASRVFGCSALNAGIHPPVVSAVLKTYTTEIARNLGQDGMDICAGAGVMQGPNNILAKGYCSAAVGVTVEGANILTRTLIIFGQGAIRCHPFALKVVDSVVNKEVSAFRSALLAWMIQFVAGLIRTVFLGLTRGRLMTLPDVAVETGTYYRRIAWAAARFGFLTNMAMFAIGGKLKARGKLTGRYADVLAWMLMATATLRRFEAEGRRAEDLPLVHYALTHALSEMQKAFEGIYANFDGVIGHVLRFFATLPLRLNPLAAPPDDAMSHAAARCIQTCNSQYLRLTEGIYKPEEGSPGLGRLQYAFRLSSEIAPILTKIREAQLRKTLPKGAAEELADLAAANGVISHDEAGQVVLARATGLSAIEVDVFRPEQYYAASRGLAGIYTETPCTPRQTLSSDFSAGAVNTTPD
ncbi:MAG: acyl-CoA dehydrogenase [Fluviicoccus sp.]|uniref:acyl-CoA dehydrogenase n=1 Tax=Fluviicoccus sp. TaxID=2003552 RepID=UPI0027244EB6|nr:acyl-CoA dehydrogenase [Fluviicoccus sp.]MDO8331382.1 acyl-CoA dehydrogenase [Fluviicoccus sp.]